MLVVPCYTPLLVSASNERTPGGAVHFAGATNDACELANAKFATTTVGFTVAFWFRVTTDTGSPSLTSLSSDGTAGWRAQYSGNPTFGARFQVVNNGGTPANSPYRSCNLNTWNLFVGANANTGVDLSNLIYVSLNGEAKQTNSHSTAGPMNVGTNKFAVGYDTLGNGSYYTGDIEEVGYWNRVLTDVEIATLWNNGLGINYASVSDDLLLNNTLTAYYSCEDRDGQNLKDSTSNALTLVGKNGTNTYTTTAGYV